MRTMTLAQAAELLFTTSETVSAMIRNEGLPAAKVGRAYVLVDVDVIDWLRARYPSNAVSATSTSPSTTPRRFARPTSATAASALDAALARPTAKRKT